MRTKIKTKKGRLGFWEALGINAIERPRIENILIESMKSNQQVSTAIEKLWNNKDIPDNELILMLVGIGRAQSQTEMLEGVKKIIGENDL